VCTILAVAGGVLLAQTRPGFAGVWRPAPLATAAQDVTISQDAATLAIVSPGGGKTNVYVREGRVWKIVHHHTDLSPDMIALLTRLQAKS